jgi:RNase P subunit RPR2
MKTRLRMKCENCGCWNRFEVNKLFIEQPSPEPKVKIIIPFYEPLKVEKCKKCGNLLTEPKTLVRITSEKMSERNQP